MGAAPIPAEIWRLAVVIAFGAFMSQLDTSVVNVGLDRIAGDLDSDLGEVQWVANAYLIALGVSLPCCGWLARRLGAGRLWLWSLLAFTASSALCAAAPSVGWLVALRVVQGLAAGLLVPAGQTVLGRPVGPERLGRVMATLGIAVTLAPALGPALGGLLLEAGSWPWLFVVNVPLGALALALGARFVPRGEPAPAGRLDGGGLALAAIGVPLVVYGATACGDAGRLTAEAAIPVAAGLIALAAFVVRSRRVAHPILDLGLFADRTFAAAGATAACAGAAMFGGGILLPLLFQIGRGEGVVATGLLLVSLGAGTAAALPLAGRLVDRFGGGVVCLAGATGTALTTVPFALVDLDADGLLLQALLALRGAAIALAVMPATTAAYKAVTPDELPDATTLVNILLRVGGALGGALFTVVLAARLPSGTQAAFHHAFWWLTAASALGLLSALWLTAAERSARPRAPAPTAA
ncbi:MAG TPA: DHA2 family efflux MFS transporter permease subunit [Capillimicrobium sp.]|nr:DHA2 family efflux MFS transporter permease subunit [Capillimicrobium sp.]